MMNTIASQVKDATATLRLVVAPVAFWRSRPMSGAGTECASNCHDFSDRTRFNKLFRF